MRAPKALRALKAVKAFKAFRAGSIQFSPAHFSSAQLKFLENIYASKVARQLSELSRFSALSKRSERSEFSKRSEPSKFSEPSKLSKLSEHRAGSVQLSSAQLSSAQPKFLEHIYASKVASSPRNCK